MANAPHGMNTPAEEVRLRAIGLAKVLNIPTSSFTARERQAYTIMSYIAAMPTVADHGRRHALANEILQNADRLMPISQPQNQQFFAAVQGLVITMQEFPAWYTKLRASNEQIVNDYVLGTTVLKGMKLIGMGGLLAPSGAAIKGGIKAAQTAMSSGARAAAVSGARGALTGAVGTVTGGLAGPLAVGWAVGSVACIALDARMQELADEITRRYREQRLSPELYQKAFGPGVAMPERYFYDIR